MKRLALGQTARKFAAIAAWCVIDLAREAFIGVRYSMGTYVILPHAPFWFPNTLQWQ